MSNTEAPITNLVMVRAAADTTVHPSGAITMGPDGVEGFRIRMIKMGLEAEMKGWRLTRKAPRCFKIIADEFGIKVKRSADGKRQAYLAFCAQFGLQPKL